MKREYRYYGNVPKTFYVLDFGFDHTVEAFNDFSIQHVRVVDMWGSFIPVPFPIWDSIVNKRLHPAVMKLHEGINTKAAYEQAISMYCKSYQHLYVCKN